MYNFNPTHISGLYPARFQSRSVLAQSDEALREDLQKKLIQQRLLGPTKMMTEITPHAGLPLKELPPGNVASLYLLYVAYVRGTATKPAGKSTFYSVWQMWKCCLKFRPETSHAMCLECQTLKSKIHDAKVAWYIFENLGNINNRQLVLLFYYGFIADMKSLHIHCPPQDFKVHSELCSKLLEHYAAQWRDREVYWKARDRSIIHGDLLTVIVDSFDRSKLYLPKFPLNRTPKRPAYQAYSRFLEAYDTWYYVNLL